MKTRQDYLNGKCTHSEYYAQFLDDKTAGELLAVIPLEQLKASKDKHLNDIPMRLWDSISGGIWDYKGKIVQQHTARKEFREKARELGDGISSSSLTCIYKEQARQLINNN